MCMYQEKGVFWLYKNVKIIEPLDIKLAKKRKIIPMIFSNKTLFPGNNSLLLWNFLFEIIKTLAQLLKSCFVYFSFHTTNISTNIFYVVAKILIFAMIQIYFCA